MTLVVLRQVAAAKAVKFTAGKAFKDALNSHQDSVVSFAVCVAARDGQPVQRPPADAPVLQQIGGSSTP